MELPDIAENLKCQVQGWKLGNTIREDFRPPRLVRVAVIQNSIVKPTTVSLNQQRDAIHKKIIGLLEHAAACKVNIVCLQEAWRKKAFLSINIIEKLI